MKKISLIIALAFTIVLSVNAQTRVAVSRTYNHKMVVIHKPAKRAVVTAPARAVVVHPVVRRRLVIIY
jgi:hypothetical protein